MSNLIITSSDGHAMIPPALWGEYLEKKFHKYLDRLRGDVELFCGSMLPLSGMRTTPEAVKIFDRDNLFASGKWSGVWDFDVRLAQLNREGVAAELVFPGDQHSLDLFWNTTNSTYPADVADAGARAYNRWCYDTFGKAKDRFLMIGAPLSGLDFDAMKQEARWMAEHGFAGVWTPNYTAMPGQIPIYDAHWDPLWALYAQSNLVLINHAGWGLPQGFMHGEIEAAVAAVKAEGGSRDDLNNKLLAGVFGRQGVFSDLRSRQGMWQLMLSGVFERHPSLKLMETEVRADWIPATLKALDEIWAKNRDKLPAKRSPSETWASHCMAGLSFMNKAEVDIRHEIGVETMAFGRDYPHTEGTWPNTIEYFSEIMRGVPEKETRAILGENMVRFLGLDRAKMAKIAKDIGAPTFEQIAAGPALSKAMIEHLGIRSGYSNPCEGGSRIAEIEPMLKSDVKRIAAAALAY